MKTIQTACLIVMALSLGHQLIERFTLYPSFAQALEACDRWEKQQIQRRHCDIDQGLSRAVDGYESAHGSDNRIAVKAFRFR